LIEIERIEEAIDRHGARLLERLFTSNELAEVGDNSTSLAARFAAKEAVAKTLGCGIGKVSWQEIEVLRTETGQPMLNLHGEANKIALAQGLTRWSISLSHTQEHAIAIAVALGE